MVIGEAKYSYENDAKEYSDIYHSKLNYAFSLCFEKLINQNLENGMLLDSCKDMWNEFTSFAQYNDNLENMKLLPHVQVLNNLQENINSKFKLDNTYGTSNLNNRIK